MTAFFCTLLSISISRLGVAALIEAKDPKGEVTQFSSTRMVPLAHYRYLFLLSRECYRVQTAARLLAAVQNRHFVKR